MILRRALLLSTLPMPALAAPAQRGPRKVEARLRAGAPPVTLELAAVPRERIVRIRAAGAVTGEVVLPSQLGGVGSARVLPLAGREVVVVNMAGLNGPGVTQLLGAVIAADDEGRLRIIGIENLDARETSTCESTGRLLARPEAGEGGTLRLAWEFRRERGACGERWAGRPVREAWAEALTWDGRGALRGEAPADAPPLRRAIAAARAKVAAMLAAPVADLRGAPWEDTGVTDLILLGLG